MSRFRQDPGALRRLRRHTDGPPEADTNSRVTPKPASAATETSAPPTEAIASELALPSTAPATPASSSLDIPLSAAPFRVMLPAAFRRAAPTLPAADVEPSAPPDASPPAFARWQPAPRPQRRFFNGNDIAMLLAGVLVVALIAAGVARAGLGPFVPTAAGADTTIEFTRVMRIVHAPQARLTASQAGGAQIVTQVQSATFHQSSAPIPASFFPGVRVALDLSVHNSATSGASITSPSGLSVPSGDGQLSCTTTEEVQVAPGATVTQHCQLPPQQVSAATWSYSANGLAYVGSSPAGGSAPYYFVPTPCGDPAGVEADAKHALDTKLQQSTPAGMLVVFGPVYSFPDDAIGCTPQAGTIAPSGFTFTIDVEGTATQTIVNPIDAKNYQLQQMQRVAGTLSGRYVMVTSSACPGGPSVVPGTAAQAVATLSCPAGGIAGWSWDPSVLNQLANTLRGFSVDDATARLDSTPGIQPGSAQITVAGGGTTLPLNSSLIHFKVDDTPPPVLVVGIDVAEADCAQQHYPTWFVSNGGGGTLTWSGTTDRPGVNLVAPNGSNTAGQEQQLTLTGRGPLTGPIHVNFTSNGGEDSLTLQCITS